MCGISGNILVNSSGQHAHLDFAITQLELVVN